MTKHIVISVLFFKEPGSPLIWVAQGLEHDIAAHGGTIEAAKRAFERTVAGYFQLAAKHNQEPLASLKPAPDLFWQVWQGIAEKETESFGPIMPDTPPAYVIQAITNQTISAIQ